MYPLLNSCSIAQTGQYDMYKSIHKGVLPANNAWLQQSTSETNYVKYMYENSIAH